MKAATCQCHCGEGGLCESTLVPTPQPSKRPTPSKGYRKGVLQHHRLVIVAKRHGPKAASILCKKITLGNATLAKIAPKIQMHHEAAGFGLAKILHDSPYSVANDQCNKDIGKSCGYTPNGQDFGLTDSYYWLHCCYAPTELTTQLCCAPRGVSSLADW